MSNLETYPVYQIQDVDFKIVVNSLKTNNEKGVILLCENVEKSWSLFLKLFKVYSAAGGLVVNSLNQVLFIYRNERWDLPKGHIEIGESIEETAVREVEEECGITSLILDQFLLKTYHIFFKSDEICIKETYWYLMNSEYSGKLTPQLDEGITEVGFKDKEEVEELFENTYANIKLVYQEYEQNYMK